MEEDKYTKKSILNSIDALNRKIKKVLNIQDSANKDNQASASSKTSLKWGLIIFIFILFLFMGGYAISELGILGIFRDLFIQEQVQDLSSSNKYGAYYDNLLIERRTEGNKIIEKKVLYSYSQVRNVYEDNEWKRIENARSLNNSGIKFKKIVDDGVHDFELIDFNYTSIKFYPVLKDSKELLKNVPIKKDGIIKTTFNYVDLDNRQQVTFYGETLKGNYSIGATSTTFSVTSVNEIVAYKVSGGGWVNRGDTNNGGTASSTFGTTTADIRRAFINFSLSQLPATANVLRANFSFIRTAVGDFGENYTIILKNASLWQPTVSNTFNGLEDWQSGATSPYNANLGINLSVFPTNLFHVFGGGTQINLSFTEDGNTRVEQYAGRDFRIAGLSECDLQVCQGSPPATSQAIGVGDDFTTAPVLYIEYEITTNTAPNITSGYPQINSTNGLNFTNRNLTTIWIGTDVDPNNILKYNITWYTNNNTNFTLRNLDYTNGTLQVNILNSQNLTSGQTWKSMIDLCDNSSACVQRNTSELLIRDGNPTYLTMPFLNSTYGLNITNETIFASFIAQDPTGVGGMLANISWLNSTDNTNFRMHTSYNDTAINDGSLTVFRLESANTSKNQYWRFQITISSSSGTNATNSTTIQILNSAPYNFTLNNPPDNLMTANYSISLNTTRGYDEDNDTINYEFWIEREVNPPTIIAYNNTDNMFNYSINQDGRYFWRVRLNDNQSVSAYSDIRSFLVDRRTIIEVIQSFNGSAFFGTNQTFIVNVTLNLTMINDINATLTNNTLILNATKEQLASNKYRFTTHRVIPNNNTLYFWNFTMSYINGTLTYNTSYILLQSIDVHSLYDCSISGDNETSIVAFNFTSKNEDNDTIIKMNWQGEFVRWFDFKHLNETFNFGLKQNTTNVKICSSPRNATFIVDSSMLYSGRDTIGTQTQDSRYYYLREDVAGNRTGIQDIGLYLLDITRAAAINFIVKDNADLGIQNAIIILQRKDVGNNTYTTVAMGKTDSNGEVPIYLRLTDRTYKVLVELISLQEFNQGDVVFSSSPYTIRLTLPSIITKLFDFNKIETTLTFSNASRTFSATFNDPNNAISSGCFLVTRFDPNQTESIIYDRCILGTSGSFNVYIGNNTNINYYAAIYANRNPSKILQDFFLNPVAGLLSLNLGKEGAFYTLMLTLSLVMIGLWKPEIAVVFSLLGIIISSMFGFLYISFGTLIALLISGAMLIYKISKR